MNTLTVSLPLPAKILWPNGRTRNFRWKAWETAKHKGWAMTATQEEPRPDGLAAPIPVHLTIYPKAKGPLPDADNCIGACKAYLDGIAAALKINDRDLAAPTVAFGPRQSRIEITVGPITEGEKE